MGGSLITLSIKLQVPERLGVQPDLCVLNRPWDFGGFVTGGTHDFVHSNQPVIDLDDLSFNVPSTSINNLPFPSTEAEPCATLDENAAESSKLAMFPEIEGTTRRPILLLVSRVLFPFEVF